MKKSEELIKMDDVSKDTSKYSGKSSQLSHQLMIAGVVVVWVVNSIGNPSSDPCSNASIPLMLWIALAFFILGLIFSVAHYMISAILSERFYHQQKKLLEEKGITDIKNAEVKEPPFHEKFTWLCFYIKHATMMIGYVFVLIYMLQEYC